MDSGEHDADHEHDHDDEQPPLDAGTTPDAGYDWQLPPGFPVPLVPEDNRMTAAKVELGRHLFYDRRLSDNRTQSCASCHDQARAFTDGRKTGVGSTGEAHPRNAMSLVNIAYAASLTWANPLFSMGAIEEPLERQSELPMYGHEPVELGLTSQREIEDRLRAEPRYAELFAAAFPHDAEPITAANLARALACFERALVSGRSPFDRDQYDRDATALTESQQRGYALFFGEKLECFHCHAGFDFTDHVHYASKATIELHYHNTGLYNVDGKGGYPEPNTGVYNVTRDPRDMGAFKAPTLRNIAVTAPYMHDGSIATLSDVLDHYAAGGRSGANNPLKDKLVRGFTLSESERADVLAFLDSLTDTDFLTNPRFSDPWK